MGSPRPGSDNGLPDAGAQSAPCFLCVLPVFSAASPFETAVATDFCNENAPVPISPPRRRRRRRALLSYSAATCGTGSPTPGCGRTEHALGPPGGGTRGFSCGVRNVSVGRNARHKLASSTSEQGGVDCLNELADRDRPGESTPRTRTQRCRSERDVHEPHELIDRDASAAVTVADALRAPIDLTKNGDSRRLGVTAAPAGHRCTGTSCRRRSAPRSRPPRRAANRRCVVVGWHRTRPPQRPRQRRASP